MAMPSALAQCLDAQHSTLFIIFAPHVTPSAPLAARGAWSLPVRAPWEKSIQLSCRLSGCHACRVSSLTGAFPVRGSIPAWPHARVIRPWPHGKTWVHSARRCSASAMVAGRSGTVVARVVACRPKVTATAQHKRRLRRRPVLADRQYVQGCAGHQTAALSALPLLHHSMTSVRSNRTTPGLGRRHGAPSRTQRFTVGMETPNQSANSFMSRGFSLTC